MRATAYWLSISSRDSPDVDTPGFWFSFDVLLDQASSIKMQAPGTSNAEALKM